MNKRTALKSSGVHGLMEGGLLLALFICATFAVSSLYSIPASSPFLSETVATTDAAKNQRSATGMLEVQLQVEVLHGWQATVSPIPDEVVWVSRTDRVNNTEITTGDGGTAKIELAPSDNYHISILESRFQLDAPVRILEGLTTRVIIVADVLRFDAFFAEVQDLNHDGWITHSEAIAIGVRPGMPIHKGDSLFLALHSGTSMDSSPALNKTTNSPKTVHVIGPGTIDFPEISPEIIAPGGEYPGTPAVVQSISQGRTAIWLQLHPTEDMPIVGTSGASIYMYCVDYMIELGKGQ